MNILELAVTRLVKKEHQASLSLLKSIPWIGPKTSIILLVLIDGFNRFSSALELCSYAGLTPLIRHSGSSVHGRARISKMSNQKLRNLLFMHSCNASCYNTACKALFDRLLAKGKSKKLALIVVCNKLLKQAFAVVKSGLKYDSNYKGQLIKIYLLFATVFSPNQLLVSNLY